MEANYQVTGISGTQKPWIIFSDISKLFMHLVPVLSSGEKKEGPDNVTLVKGHSYSI